MKFKLALIQMRVDGGEKEKNIARAEARIQMATSTGTRRCWPHGLRGWLCS